jgi:hypothetical protein
MVLISQSQRLVADMEELIRRAKALVAEQQALVKALKDVKK